MRPLKMVIPRPLCRTNTGECVTVNTVKNLDVGNSLVICGIKPTDCIRGMRHMNIDTTGILFKTSVIKSFQAERMKCLGFSCFGKVVAINTTDRQYEIGGNMLDIKVKKSDKKALVSLSILEYAVLAFIFIRIAF